MKTLVVYHRSDYDGIASMLVCCKFLEESGKEVTRIGVEYGDVPHQRILSALARGTWDDDIEEVYVVDFSLKDVFNVESLRVKIRWIDHHATAILKWGQLNFLDKYVIDGVAACRLCWQYFNQVYYHRPADKQPFVDRSVREPLLLRLLGEWDIWDKRDPACEFVQLGLMAQDSPNDFIREALQSSFPNIRLDGLISTGKQIAVYRHNIDLRLRSSMQRVEFGGATFIACNTRGNSLTFRPSLDVVPDAEALLMWFRSGSICKVSLYSHPDHPDIDLSRIAIAMGGGGHKGACGFECSWEEMEYILYSAIDFSFDKKADAFGDLRPRSVKDLRRCPRCDEECKPGELRAQEAAITGYQRRAIEAESKLAHVLAKLKEGTNWPELKA